MCKLNNYQKFDFAKNWTVKKILWNKNIILVSKKVIEGYPALVSSRCEGIA